MKYKYIFIGSEPVTFPIQGIEAKKDDVIESDEPLNSPLLKEVIDSPKEDLKK